jgi:hypothetical protein
VLATTPNSNNKYYRNGGVRNTINQKVLKHVKKIKREENGKWKAKKEYSESKMGESRREEKERL